MYNYYEEIGHFKYFFKNTKVGFIHHINQSSIYFIFF